MAALALALEFGAGVLDDTLSTPTPAALLDVVARWPGVTSTESPPRRSDTPTRPSRTDTLVSSLEMSTSNLVPFTTATT
jgi:hypothetical protein